MMDLLALTCPPSFPLGVPSSCAPARQCAPALALMGYTFLFFWFVGGLSAFHAYLVGTNQTTYENFRWGWRGAGRDCAATAVGFPAQWQQVGQA